MKHFTIEEQREMGVPIAEIARRVELPRRYIYTYLDPGSYPGVRLSDSHLEKIARFEGRSLSAVRRDFLSRKAA